MHGHFTIGANSGLSVSNFIGSISYILWALFEEGKEYINVLGQL
jgi:hypothetical protein